MAHINTLYDNDLYDIFHLVLGKPPSSLDKWKKHLPLLQVCRKWYDMLYHYVYSRGFVEMYPKDDKYGRRSGSIKDCVYYSNNELVCRSNLGIITGRNEYNCKCVSSVRVVSHWGLEIPQYGPVLIKLLNLGVGYWLSLTSLELVGRTYDNKNSVADKRLREQLIATARKHILALKSKAPNITRLHIQWSGDIAFFVSPILEKYAGCLQYLDCFYPSQRLPSLYSEELTHLTLELDKISYKLPKIYAKPLRDLHLRDVPGDFTWHCFHDGLTTGRIEFTNLETFILAYQDQTDDQKAKSLKYSKQARPYGSYMLRFPKLSELTIENCPVDCDILFTDTMPSHIKLLDIDGGVNAIVAVSKLRCEKVNDLIFKSWDAGTLSDEFYEAANYYFKKLQISGRCSLSLRQSLDVQRTGLWVNLKCLHVNGILFNDLLKLIPKLRNLQALSLGYIDLGDDFTSIIEHGREDEKHGRIECLETKIADISILYVKPKSLDNFVDCANHLLARMPTVGEFISIDNIYIRESFLPTKFPNVGFSIAPYVDLDPWISYLD